MKSKKTIMIVALVPMLAVTWYLAEPQSATFMDDGPYYSTHFPETTHDLPLIDSIELKRLGRNEYTLESRLLFGRKESVLVLKDAKGVVQWARLPLKPDGDLGWLKFHSADTTWYGGWKIRISPSLQEGGYLYLGFFGGFRFFNHSW